MNSVEKRPKVREAIWKVIDEKTEENG